jgi:hypothetical protein
VSWSEELRRVSVLNLNYVGIEMMKYPASLKAESLVVRAYAPWQRGLMLRREPQDQARGPFAARARKRNQKNVKTSVALEAKALGGGRVEVSAALMVVTSTPKKMASLLEDHYTAIAHAIRQLRGPTKCF